MEESKLHRRKIFELIMGQNVPNGLKTYMYKRSSSFIVVYILDLFLFLAQDSISFVFKASLYYPNTYCCLFKTIDGYNRITFWVFKNFALIPFFSTLISRKKPFSL